MSSITVEVEHTYSLDLSGRPGCGISPTWPSCRVYGSPCWGRKEGGQQESWESKRDTDPRRYWERVISDAIAAIFPLTNFSLLMLLIFTEHPKNQLMNQHTFILSKIVFIFNIYIRKCNTVVETRKD